MDRMVFAFKAKKENLLESSSGGAFFALAETFFKHISGKKCVFGAAYNENCNIIASSAETIEDCKKFRGSKYAECDYSTSLLETKDKLTAGYSVLYTGIPCQISALLYFLKTNKTDISKLFTVDIICHGLPHKKIWDDYKRELEKKYKGTLKQVYFRYKKTKSAEPVIAAEFTDGRLIKETQLIRSYMTLYFTYLPLKASCYKCKFSNMNRISDITIGDFWGIEKVIPNFPAKDGTSEIIVNTEKGFFLTNFLGKCSGITMERCYSKDFNRYQHNLNRPTDKPQNVSQFWNDYNEKGYNFIITKYADITYLGRIIFGVKKVLRYMGVYSKMQNLLRRKSS